MIVDFTDTTFIDSTTLGVLVSGVKRLRTKDGELSIVCSDRNITKIFEITGLDRVFTIYPTRAEAVEQIDAASRLPRSEPPPLALWATLGGVALAAPAAAPAASTRRAPTRPTARSCSVRSAAPATRWPTPERTGKVGPNLDDAFAGLARRRASRSGRSATSSATRSSIAVAEPSGVITATGRHRSSARPGCRANLVTGEDAKDVAAYVASVAGMRRGRAAADGDHDDRRPRRPRADHDHRGTTTERPARRRRRRSSRRGRGSSRRPAARAATR